MEAWAAVQEGRANPLANLLAADPEIVAHLAPEAVRAVLAAGAGVGDAPARSRAMAAAMRAAVGPA
jgi:hypothetical protein